MSYAEIKEKRFMRKGEEAGTNNENFYITDESNVTYELSAAVYYVWKLADGIKTVEEIVKQASSELNMPEEELQEPIAVIMLKLLENNLVSESLE
ncbi:MAG: PqqD family protein [Fervidicoccaceae archaeon]